MFPPLFILLLFGLLGLYRFSHGVRSVDAVGLFASGAACGAAFVGLVRALRGKS
jgi:hypothetical protein